MNLYPCKTWWGALQTRKKTKYLKRCQTPLAGKSRYFPSSVTFLWHGKMPKMLKSFTKGQRLSNMYMLVVRPVDLYWYGLYLVQTWSLCLNSIRYFVCRMVGREKMLVQLGPYYYIFVTVTQLRLIRLLIGIWRCCVRKFQMLRSPLFSCKR